MLDYLPGKKLLNNLGKEIKGSIKDPSFRLRVITLFLLIFAFLAFGLAVRSLAGKSDFYSANIFNIFKGPGENDLFIGSSNSFFPESPEFLLVDNSFIKASSPPITFSFQTLATLVGSYEQGENARMTIIEHIVESGDSLSSLAVKYGISLDTILWANNLTKDSMLKIGQKLVILPVSGTVHHVKSGDTISGIAETHKGKIDEIIAFNLLSGEGDIYIEDIIIIPNGVMPAPSVQERQVPASAPLASSYFIAPVSLPYIVTQGLHWYNAIDFSHEGNACGKPVFAVAGGTIQRTGFDRTAGNYVRILHPNGVITFYGHLSSILVFTGQSVSQGGIIGYMGNTGYTIGRTGCHLHFEVRGAGNLFAQ